MGGKKTQRKPAREELDVIILNEHSTLKLSFMFPPARLNISFKIFIVEVFLLQTCSVPFFSEFVSYNLYSGQQCSVRICYFRFTSTCMPVDWQTMARHQRLVSSCFLKKK